MALETNRTGLPSASAMAMTSALSCLHLSAESGRQFDDTDGPVGFPRVIEHGSRDAAGRLLRDHTAAGIEGFIEFGNDAQRAGSGPKRSMLRCVRYGDTERSVDHGGECVPVAWLELSDAHGRH